MLGKLERNRALLLVIDLQEKLLPAICAGQTCAEAAAKLIRGAQALGIPLQVTEQYPAGLGRTCAPLAVLLSPEDKPIEKTVFSACVPETRAAIEKAGRSQIIVCGVETHVCVQQTVLDLLRDGKEVWLCADAVGSRREIDRDIALKRMRHAGAAVTTVESALFELLGEAGTDDFKKILKIVK